MKSFSQYRHELLRNSYIENLINNQEEQKEKDSKSSEIFFDNARLITRPRSKTNFNENK